MALNMIMIQIQQNCIRNNALSIFIYKKELVPIKKSFEIRLNSRQAVLKLLIFEML